MISTNFELSNLTNFISTTAEADFLFGPEIPRYIDGIYDHGAELLSAKDECEALKQPGVVGGVTSEPYNKAVNVMLTQKKWVGEQIKIVKEKFKKYLDIRA